MRKISLILIAISFSIALFGQVPTDSLIFYMPFDGHFNDVVGKISGKASGGQFTQDRHINDSASIYLDGKNDFIDLATDLQIADIDNFSSSFWLLPAAVNYTQPGGPKSGRYTILGDAADGYGFRFFQYTNQLHFSVAAGTGIDYCYYSLSSYQENNWVHLVGVSNNGMLSIYANGNLISKVKATNNNRKLGQLNFEIGRGTQLDNVYWEGRIDEIRIYNKALDGKEIKNLYLAEKNKEITCSDSIKVYDTTFINITQYDTIKSYVTFYDTATIIKTVYDTVAVDDTLIIRLQTGSSTYPIHQLMLYPNPTGSALNIDAGSYSKIPGYSFSITNTLGQTVWASLANAQYFTINVSSLGANGLYYFNVFDSKMNKIEVKKLLIN